MSIYGVISGLYFPAFGLNTERYVFSPNAGKYGPGETPYLDTFHAVTIFVSTYAALIMGYVEIRLYRASNL